MVQGTARWPRCSCGEGPAGEGSGQDGEGEGTTLHTGAWHLGNTHLQIAHAKHDMLPCMHAGLAAGTCTQASRLEEVHFLVDCSAFPPSHRLVRYVWLTSPVHRTLPYAGLAAGTWRRRTSWWTASAAAPRLQHTTKL